MKCYSKPISELRDLYKNKQIELDPPYQRRPAWQPKQRRLLLSSLFNGIPIPSLIFHKHYRSKQKKYVYDVLDGKQRLETIFHFIELINLKNEDELYVEFINPNNNKKDRLYYGELCSKKVNKEYENIFDKFWLYEIPIIEYEGDLSDIFDRNVATKEVFVRINSTGSPLKRHEIRHAHNAGYLFDLGDKLEKQYMPLFYEKWKIISKTDIDRYLFHEFILELCTVCYESNYSDRRKELDKLLSQHKWNKNEINKVQKKFNKIVTWIKDIFPDNTLRPTRFKNKSDFYSLFAVLLKLADNGYVTIDKKSNRVAGKFLLYFSKQLYKIDNKVDITKVHKLKLSEPEKRLFPYISATRHATDSRKNREIRDSYLMSMLKGGFFLKSKDSKRSFDKSVKDILWIELIEKSTKPKCPNPTKNNKCYGYLKYSDAQVDHKYPWSKGGSSKDLKNAQLLCPNCNRSKGNR